MSIHTIFKQYYGYDAFRPLQEDIINAILTGNDTLALLPTGGGKSVCYQVPALAMDGICIVITPLIALIKDQVRQLHKRNISALAIYSGMGWHEIKKTLENAGSGEFKFLYISPERLQTKLFREYLPGMPVNLIAVDEAHCISQWGYDFRPQYLQIASIREDLPHVPILALTASATQDVQDDICEKLLFKKPHIYRQSFNRPNLSFSAFDTPHKINKLVDILQKVPGTALVYCRNRRRTKEIAGLLQMHDIPASFYHAGLTAEERSNRQDDWIGNKVRVMACTNAFGMGIDKPDVRVVVHMDVPDCPENYYQEAGRAGRDGKRSYAVLLYTSGELQEMQKLPAQKYPPSADIQRVYEAVCNYLQMPAGSGAGEYYDFDLDECCERFKLEPMLLVNVLKTLEQAGYISFSDHVFIPAKAGFIVQKNELYEFEASQPKLEPLLKALLRNYEGIFDNVVNISEKTLGRLLRIELPEVKQQLQQLVYHHIIDYRPQKDTPQLFFLHDRVRTEALYIDMVAYEKRKQLYTYRLNEMIRYTATQTQCRSEFIRRYFGDAEAEQCGICDICLARKTVLLDDKTLHATALKAAVLLQQRLSLHQLQTALKISGTQGRQLADYLLREEMAVQLPDGSFRAMQIRST